MRDVLARKDDSGFYANDLSKEINDEGLRRLREAQVALKHPIDRTLRRTYERDWFSPLPGLRFDPSLFESIRKRGIAALADPTLSPCLFFHGNQITRDMRRFTSDVAAVVPDVTGLLSPEIAGAIRSCIGGNFFVENVYLTRNFHVEREINARYEILSERWYFDHQYPDGFSLFVNLSHVTEADGPTHIISAADSRRILAKGFDAEKRKADPNGGLTREEFESVPSFTRLVGPPGTMILCHTSYCLHRAGMPEPGHIRDMLIFTFRPG